jgi:hypothetical protein
MIRDAQISDFHTMAQVMAAAFMEEELFGDLINPHRHSYPDDFIMFFEREIWSHWYDWNRRYLVNCEEETGRILGVAQWERQGGGGQMALGTWDAREW